MTGGSARATMGVGLALTLFVGAPAIASAFSGGPAGEGSASAGPPVRAGEHAADSVRPSAAAGPRATGVTTDRMPQPSAMRTVSEASSAVGDRPAASGARSAYASDRLGQDSPPRRFRNGSLVVGRGEPYTVSATPPHEPYGATVERTIREAAVYHGADAVQLLRVARCESGLNPAAVGDHGASIGLMQFQAVWLPLGHRLGYAGDWRRDPYASADVAAHLFARGEARWWTCK